MIVNETEIISQRSPLSDGNPTADTPNFATFKLLLTGVDSVGEALLELFVDQRIDAADKKAGH